MLPPHQRLDALQGAVHADLRLVVQDQLAGLDRHGEVGEQPQPLGGVVVVGGVVDDNAAVGALGDVHRDIGVLQHRAGVGRVGRVHDRPALASTTRGTPSTSRGSRSAPRSASAERTASARLGTSGSRTANSSPPRRATMPASPTWLRQPRGDLADECITVSVPEGVVDVAEAVEVEQHENRRVARVAGLRDGRADADVQRRAVRQPGQGVMRGLVLVALGLVPESARGTRNRVEQAGPQHDQSEREQTRRP